MDLTYTPLSDGFKVAQDENGNIVFARNGTTLFVASAGDLHTALTPLIGAVATPAQPVVDTTTADALNAANEHIAQLQADAVANSTLMVAQEKTIAELQAQIAADQQAAAAIAEAMQKAQGDAAGQKPAADGAPSSSEPAAAPTITPSNTGITGS